MSGSLVRACIPASRERTLTTSTDLKSRFLPEIFKSKGIGKTLRPLYAKLSTKEGAECEIFLDAKVHDPIRAIPMVL